MVFLHQVFKALDVRSTDPQLRGCARWLANVGAGCRRSQPLDFRGDEKMQPVAAKRSAH